MRALSGQTPTGEVDVELLDPGTGTRDADPLVAQDVGAELGGESADGVAGRVAQLDLVVARVIDEVEVVQVAFDEPDRLVADALQRVVGDDRLEVVGVERVADGGERDRGDVAGAAVHEVHDRGGVVVLLAKPGGAEGTGQPDHVRATG